MNWCDHDLRKVCSLVCLTVDGNEYKYLPTIASVENVERVVFRTGGVRKLPDIECDYGASDLPNADEPVREAIYYVNYIGTEDAVQ